MKRTIAIFGALVLFAVPALAGEWHSGANNLCTDCHTMHFSMQHNWDGTTPVPTTGTPDGNWLGGTGPNDFLLKAPANQLCLACHDGLASAPDVFEVNFNASPTEGRMAGGLNDLTSASPYQTWKGHTLDSLDAPPGYNPDVIAVGSDPYPAGSQLECVSCHAQHGAADAYRNLGPFSWGFSVYSQVRPEYVISTTNDLTKDVWINITSHTANSGVPATFNPYYDYANINYNRIDTTSTGGNESSNKLDALCGTCHGDFHGGPLDTNIGAQVATPAGWDHFNRHPTSQNTIGLVGGGHSNLLSYYANVGNVQKVKTYTTDYTTYADASPGCVSCHKAHGNQNPFSLFFLHGAAATITEQGGYEATQVEMANGYGVGFMNLCGQCHTQGINWDE